MGPSFRRDDGFEVSPCAYHGKRSPGNPPVKEFKRRMNGPVSKASAGECQSSPIFKEGSMTRISLTIAILALTAFGAEAAMTNPGNSQGQGNSSASQGNTDGGNGEVRKPKKKDKKGNQQEFLIIKLQEILVTG
jgi:hypothetical protein